MMMIGGAAGDKEHVTINFDPDSVDYERDTTRTYCCECKEIVWTDVSTETSAGTWIWFACTVIFCCVLGCCLLPFCCKRCKVTAKGLSY